MPRFRPRRCPFPSCPSRSGGAEFAWTRKGSFRRKVDGRRVPRFACKACGRRFSFQSFRLDYRLHRPQITKRILRSLAAKISIRQTARRLGCSRKTVELRLRLYAQAAGGHPCHKSVTDSAA